MKVLEQNGFKISRQKGSHLILRNNLTNTTLPVPLHGRNKPIPIGTLMEIIKQSKLPKSKFK